MTRILLNTTVILIILFNPYYLLKGEDNSDKLMKLYLKRALYYSTMRNFDTSFLYYDSATVIAKKINDQVHLAYIQKLKGTDLIYDNQYDSAKYYLNNSRVLASKLKIDSIKAVTTSNIGYILHLQGLSDSAENMLNESLRLYDKMQDSVGMAKAYNLLTIHYKNRGDFVKGIDCALKSIYYFEKFGEKKLYIHALINLGNIYEKLKDDDSAYSCYQLSYELSMEYNKPGTALTSIFNMAVIDVNKGKEYNLNGDIKSANLSFNRAKKIYDDAIEISQNANDTSTLAQCYNNIAGIYLIEKKYNEAIIYSTLSLEYSKAIGNVLEYIKALKSMGVCYSQKMELDLAEKYYLECLEKSIIARQNEIVKEVSLDLSVVYEKMSDYNNALIYLRLHLNYLDSLFNIEREKLIKEHQTNYEILRLEDSRHIEAMKKEKLRVERNITRRVSIFIIITLCGLLILFRMRAKKNRIIAEQKIQQLEDEKKLMRARSVLIGQENERKRIAQDLHDGIGVLLSTASIQFSKVKVDPDDPETDDLFKRATKLLNEAGGEVRKISRNMMPGVLSKLGLRDALEDLFESVNDIEGVNTILKINCSKERLPENTEIMIYRVVQELVNNTVKHAEASEITFEIDREKEIMHINYSDNGIGFDKKKVKKGKGLGLNGIRSRIDFLNGKLSLQTGKGKGTRYEIEIPLSDR